MFSAKDMPEPREPRVRLTVMLPRHQFDALAHEAARRRRGTSASSLAKEMIAAGLSALDDKSKMISPWTGRPVGDP